MQPVSISLHHVTSSNFAARASFCKCTCKTNSTIIALDGSASDSTDASLPGHGRSCTDCNRQFCLDYDLPILSDCRSENKGKEEDIYTTCFRELLGFKLQD